MDMDSREPWSRKPTPASMVLRAPLEHGIQHIIVEGDSLALIQLLRSRSTQDNSSEFFFFISSILNLVTNFDFIYWSFIKREGNKVVHDLAH